MGSGLHGADWGLHGAEGPIRVRNRSKQLRNELSESHLGEEGVGGEGRARAVGANKNSDSACAAESHVFGPTLFGSEKEQKRQAYSVLSFSVARSREHMESFFRSRLVLWSDAEAQPRPSTQPHLSAMSNTIEMWTASRDIFSLHRSSA